MKCLEDLISRLIPVYQRTTITNCRVARKLVIVVLWYSFAKGDEHEIKNIDYRPSGGELYPDEYTNSYSKKKCMEYLENKEDWEILEVTENVGAEVSGRDVVIVLKRKEGNESE